MTDLTSTVWLYFPPATFISCVDYPESGKTVSKLEEWDCPTDSNKEWCWDQRLSQEEREKPGRSVPQSWSIQYPQAGPKRPHWSRQGADSLCSPYCDMSVRGSGETVIVTHCRLVVCASQLQELQLTGGWCLTNYQRKFSNTLRETGRKEITLRAWIRVGF